MTYSPKRVKEKAIPPKDLSAAAKKLWHRLFESSDMDPAAIMILDSACQSWDRVREARALIAKDGMVLTESVAHGGVKHKAHPACAIERDSAAAMMRAWRLLGYDQSPAPE